MYQTNYYSKCSVSVDLEPFELCKCYSFTAGNIIKYLCRAGIKTKDPTDDWHKALDYLEQLKHQLVVIGEERPRLCLSEKALFMFRTTFDLVGRLIDERGIITRQGVERCMAGVDASLRVWIEKCGSGQN